MSTIQYQLDQVVRDVSEAAQKRVDDISYRMDKGIYNTPQDITAEQLWADLAESQDTPEWNMFRTFALLDELTKRGQITGEL